MRKKAKGYYGYPVEGIKGRAIAAKHYFTFPMAEMMNKVVTDTLDVDGAIGDAIEKTGSRTENCEIKGVRL